VQNSDVTISWKT